MDRSVIDETRTQEEKSNFRDVISARDEPRRMESVGDQDTENGDETHSMLAERSSYSQIPFGFHSRGSYKHASKNCEIVGVTHNSRFKQFVFLDSRGITSWSYESVYNTVTRHLNYPSYQFNVLRLIIFSRKFNVYFVLSKEYALKVFNLNFHEVFSVSAEMHSVLCMVFNHGKDELITGGTGGMKFWTFGEIDKDRQKAWERDSRPMANYGLVLRASYPDMGGSWVKQVELDEAMQRLYCLSERNVVAYDMEGNLLFQILDAHRGPVTGCVYSKACNFLVTVGTDCDVNVWSRSKSGGRVHTFTGHSKAITKIMLHPETSALVITAAMDGVVKVNSLDFMEEIYSLPVFSEGIYWMNIVSPKLIYCCSNRVIEVFSLNHLCDFWALSRCSVTSLSLVTCRGKSTRVMAVGNDSSVRLISRKRHNLSTVLPPPPISPLNMVKDVAHSREFNMMYLLIDDQEIWVYYTRTNPATRVESWKLDFIEDIHSQHSQDVLQKSRASSPWPSEGNRSPSPIADNSPSLRPSSFGREVSGRESSLSARKEKVVITCVGMLYSPIIMQSVEGQACPDATHFLMAGTQDGRVLFLHLFWKGLKYHQLQANKDAVLELYHDQVMNTLVTKCRHPGIVILIWSLPFLQLLKRVDCDADMTCFTRMNNLLLCGHKCGYLHLHSLGVDQNHELQDVKDERAGDSKRSNPKDHQDCINSVDSNSRLEIFCSASRDGVIKIWDRDKTLLREILMDETLTVASFLNNQGDILIGFKQHIFIIPNEKVYPSKDALSSAFRTDSLDDEAFETESDIYEDPSVRFESKKILQPDPTNMENYLVPFPNLQLKTSWFMEGRPPLDLEQQNQQDEEESISFMSDSLSLAPTEVYCSPSTTPRRTSLVSTLAMSERRVSTELWELPEFGDSPVSSPPRTPPPEPTPPPTPPPGEESEEEPSEGEENTDEEAQEDPSCGQCADFSKKEGKKKVSIVPTFRKAGGRMGNITIDSRALRSGYGGPGYAAPVARRVVVEKPEPKAIKPRRVPKPIIKKAKKPKENGEEENSKEEDNKEQNKTETENENAEAKHERREDKVVKKNEEEDASYRTPNVVNMPPGEQRPLVRQDVAGSRRGPGTSAIPLEKESSWTTKDEEKAHVKETGAEIRGPQDKNQSPTSQKPANGNVGKAQSAGKIPPENGGNEIPTGTENKGTDGDEKSGEALQTQQQGKSTKRLAPVPNEVPLVSYVDPDTGEVLQKPADEVPDGAEILQEYDEDEEFEGVDDFATSPAEGDLTSSVRSRRSDRGQKVVSFTPPGSNLGRPSQRNQRQLPHFHTSGRDSPTLGSPQNAGMAFKEAVVPVYDSNRPGDLFSRTSKSAVGVSSLTIFALARSRRENAMKAARKHGRSADGRLRHNQATTENFSLKNDEWYQDDFELNDADIARLMDKMDVQSQTDDRGSVSSLRPPSVRKSDSTLMRWCIGALKKSDREVLFPPKPTRPSSSPSAVKAKPSKKEGGSTLYLNAKDSQKRPKTADTIRSNATSNEEFSVFPYENIASADQTPRRQTRDHKNAAPIKVNTWKHMASDKDEDFMDAYRAMRSSIGLHESDEDYMKDVVSKDGNERLTDAREFPTVETSDYSGNWQSKMLERANRLKQQRLERQKTATERRQALENKQRERWKNSNHYECAQESVSKCESVIEFITPPPTTAAARNATPLPPQDQLQTRLFKEQELTNEQPFRLRLNSQAGGLGMNPVARNLMNLKAGEHHVSDIASVLPKPPPSASIPSKCSRYVLVAQPDAKQSPVQASPMEETLLLLRFPKSRVRRRLASATIPRLHSNRKVNVESGFEM